MPEMVKSSETKLFADDSLLFRTINNQADSVLLQNDLASLQDWEDKWQMSFNAKKCQVIRITPQNRPPLPTTYKLHGHTLDTVDASKYLGVTISNNRSVCVIIENESCCAFLYFFKVANLFPVCRVPY
jgi:hypothetical protein